MMCPHGIYPCVGEDSWIAVACRSDAEWRQLWSQMGCPGGVAAGAVWLPTLRERLAERVVLDQLVADWTGSKDARELMHRLQGLGVPAGVVMDGRDIFEDPHLTARGFHVAQERETVGLKHYLAEPFRLASATLPEPRRAPYLGEFNHAILGDVLGLGDDEIAELERDNVIGTSPVGAR
jgi:benzylsuccinate CoA-transferase BbsF subunit